MILENNNKEIKITLDLPNTEVVIKKGKELWVKIENTSLDTLEEIYSEIKYFKENKEDYLSKENIIFKRKEKNANIIKLEITLPFFISDLEVKYTNKVILKEYYTHLKLKIKNSNVNLEEGVITKFNLNIDSLSSLNTKKVNFIK